MIIKIQPPCKPITTDQYLKLLRSSIHGRFSQQLILEHPNPWHRLQFALNLVGWDKKNFKKVQPVCELLKRKSK
jgi:hypothetical protein